MVGIDEISSLQNLLSLWIIILNISKKQKQILNQQMMNILRVSITLLKFLNIKGFHMKKKNI